MDGRPRGEEQRGRWTIEGLAGSRSWTIEGYEGSRNLQDRGLVRWREMVEGLERWRSMADRGTRNVEYRRPLGSLIHVSPMPSCVQAKSPHSWLYQSNS